MVFTNFKTISILNKLLLDECLLCAKHYLSTFHILPHLIFTMTIWNSYCYYYLHLQKSRLWVSHLSRVAELVRGNVRHSDPGEARTWFSLSNWKSIACTIFLVLHQREGGSGISKGLKDPRAIGVKPFERVHLFCQPLTITTNKAPPKKR